MGQIRTFRMKRQGNKTHEPVRPILKLAKSYQVVDPIFRRLDMAVKHRRVRMEPAAMDLFGKLQPAVTRSLVRAYTAPGRIAKNLSASAWATVQPSGNQPINDLLIRQATNTRQMVQFDHRESLQMHIRKLSLEF